MIFSEMSRSRQRNRGVKLLCSGCFFTARNPYLSILTDLLRFILQEIFVRVKAA